VSIRRYSYSCNHIKNWCLFSMVLDRNPLFVRGTPRLICKVPASIFFQLFHTTYSVNSDPYSLISVEVCFFSGNNLFPFGFPEKVQPAPLHSWRPNPKPGCITVSRMTAKATIPPSSTMNVTSLFARALPKPSDSSATRKLERTRISRVVKLKPRFCIVSNSCKC